MNLLKKLLSASLFLAVGSVFLVLPKNTFAQQCGLNIDPANPLGYPSPQSVAGANWVRVEFKNCTKSNDEGADIFKSIDDYKKVIQGYVSSGTKVLLIIDYSSYPNASSDITGFAARAGVIAKAYSSFGDNIAYEVWNEPDIPQGGSLSSQAYAAILSAAAKEIKAEGGTVVTAGFASGENSYVSGVRTAMGSDWGLVDKVATHPYGKVPSPTCSLGGTGPLGSYLDGLSSAAGKPIWITEIGFGTTNQDLQSEYLTCFFKNVRSLHSNQVENIIWFAWGDGMVSPFGIVDSSSFPKRSYRTFFPACSASTPSVIENLPSIPVYADPGQSCGVPGGAVQNGPQLVISSVPIPKPYVACDQVRPDETNSETEFHSLRPYQASPCIQKVDQVVNYCGNNFYAKETFDLEPGQFGSQCTEPDANGNIDCYNYGPIKSYIQADIRLDPADLPILGNTQLVPNSINKVNVLDDATRMNEYVSWFLNGAVYQFEDLLPRTVQEILTFSGPIRKLLPESGISDLKLNQKIQSGQARHDQMVTSTERITDANLNSDNLPLASTEDRIGEVSAALKYTSGGFGGDTFFLNNIIFHPSDNNLQSVDDIYFAHTEETAQLAQDLQGTFASLDYQKRDEKLKESDPEKYYDFDSPPTRVTGFCDIKNYRTNPGDDLFGDYNDKNNPYHKYEEKISGTFEYTTDVYKGPVHFHPETKVDGACVAAGGTEESCTYFFYPPQKRYAYVALYVYTKSPKIKEIWQRLVSGPAGVAARFFPQDITLEDVPAAVSAIYDTAIAPGAQGNGTEAIAGQPYIPISGDDAKLFIPHLGSVKDYFLDGIQCALRPQGMCGNANLQQPVGVTPTQAKGICSAPSPYSQEVSDYVDQAIAKGGAASKVPKGVLEAIYSIEGFEPFFVPGYNCQKNGASALGLMQVTDSALNSVTTQSERADGEVGNCSPIEGKLNRCYPPDAIELAARVLLFKIGKLSGGQPTGSLSSKDDAYKAAYGYYGCYDPDKMTNDRGNDAWGAAQGPVPDNKDGFTNYSEVVCARSGLCKSSSDYPWPRPADSCSSATP